MAVSPMMKQYLLTKEKYSDCILLYRLGDFYEMFYEDAIKASEILNLVLTGRDCGDDKRAPMCGVPYHAVDNYIVKLINAGCKVAICEQLTEPDSTKGLVERGVVRVVTPGTLMEDTMLVENQNNFLMSLCVSNSSYGLAWADISTGECYCSCVQITDIKALQNLIVSILPTEIITNDVTINNTLPCFASGYIVKATRYNEYSYKFQHAQSVIFKQYNTMTLDNFGIGDKQSTVSALGALIEYLLDTQKRSLQHISTVKYINDKNYMSLDVNTRRNLELTFAGRDIKKKGSLLDMIDHTCTSMGGRLLHSYLERPLQDINEINNRLDSVAELVDDFLMRESIKQALPTIKDIERLAGKISYNSLSPRDCNTLKASLDMLPTIKNLIKSAKSANIIALNANIIDVTNIAALLNNAIIVNAPQLIKDGGFINTGYNEDLDKYRQLSKNSKEVIASLEAKERISTGIKTLKVGYNRVFGYYFEISNSFIGQLPMRYIRKQTLTNGERYITEELKTLEEEILNANEATMRIEKQLFVELRETLLEYVPVFQKISSAIAQLDVYLCFSLQAVNNGYCKPKMTTENSTLSITDGRHPVVEEMLKCDQFVSNDTLLDDKDNRTVILTGPNMAGKSTYMRQVALITLLAHIGSFVPASKATIPIVDKIFTRVGAYDDLAFNQSTFMVEMAEVAYILNNATKNSLIVLDEVGRGTSTYDGLSIAWAVVEYITSTIKAKTLFATHFHELTELEGKVNGIKNYKVTVKEYNDTIIFLHKIMRGGSNRSFGIEVASLAGVPEVVTIKAKSILSSLIQKINYYDTNSNTKSYSTLASIIKDININNVTPLQALDILTDLQEKVNK